MVVVRVGIYHNAEVLSMGTLMYLLEFSLKYVLVLLSSDTIRLTSLGFSAEACQCLDSLPFVGAYFGSY
jgi:hypothetical protein